MIVTWVFSINWVTFRLFPGWTVIMLLVMICSIYSFPVRERQPVARSYQMAISKKINKRFVNAVWFLGFPSCTMNLIGIQRRLLTSITSRQSMEIQIIWSAHYLQ